MRDSKPFNRKTNSFLSEETIRKDGRVHIFTDGSASTRDRSGGWGAFLVCQNYTKEISGGVFDTSIGAMELEAIRQALLRVKTRVRPLIVYSDSMYAVKALSAWWYGWSRRGWMTSSGQPVKHREIIEEIVSLQKDRIVAYQHVKGHSGVWGNERADALATSARKAMVSQSNV